VSSFLRRTLFPLTCLVGISALAQGFELDLSEDKDKVEAVSEELRPIIAVLAVVANDADEVTVNRARQFEAELTRQLTEANLFQSVLDVAAVKAQLGEGYAAAAACPSFTCYEEVAGRLKAHRLVRFTVQKQGVGSLVTGYGFDPALSEVLTQAQDSQEKAEKVFFGMAGRSQAMKDRDYMKKMSPFIGQFIKKLATPNGKISVDNAEAMAVVNVDGVVVGTGTLETIVQRGERKVTVTAPGYKPFEQTVTIEPGKTVEVKVTLIALPLETPQLVRAAPKPAGPSIFARPGLYLALGGVAVAAVGIGLGQAAQGVQARIDAGGSPVGVTRAEAKSAATHATLANVFVATGAAMAAGGVAWIILTPTASSRTSTGGGEPVDSIPVSGWMLSAGGSF
jgi:hypothetical protein